MVYKHALQCNILRIPCCSQLMFLFYLWRHTQSANEHKLKTAGIWREIFQGLLTKLRLWLGNSKDPLLILKALSEMKDHFFWESSSTEVQAWKILLHKSISKAIFHLATPTFTLLSSSSLVFNAFLAARKIFMETKCTQIPFPRDYYLMYVPGFGSVTVRTVLRVVSEFPVTITLV